jgi:hypothetical protein
MIHLVLRRGTTNYSVRLRKIGLEFLIMTTLESYTKEWSLIIILMHFVTVRIYDYKPFFIKSKNSFSTIWMVYLCVFIEPKALDKNDYWDNFYC